MTEHGELLVAENELINWPECEKMQQALGEHFVRLLGYFREDGAKSLAAIELALHNDSSGEIVMPAHSLKGESIQFGAERLSLLAEQIEFEARYYVESRQNPAELAQKIAQLRPLFEKSLAALDAAMNPLATKRKPIGFAPRGGRFGRRAG